jgi:hypothetical protein
MSYSLRKAKSGQEVVKKITLYLNACKYTQGDFITQSQLITDNPSVISSSSVGGALVFTHTNSPDWIATWADYPTYPYLYFVIRGEAIKVQVVSSTQVTIIERGMFGTTPVSITRYSVVRIDHGGRLDKSCFGYSQTCSTTDSYSTSAIKELVFSSAPLPSGSVYHGGLNFRDVSYTSSELKPGEAISSRSKISFKISDQMHNDYDFVYWPEQRVKTGTLFGKLLARNPYFNGRTVKYSVGLRDAGKITEPDWEDRKFLIDDINLSDDVFSASGLDPLILTEGKKAKMPIVATAQLTTAITSGSTSVQFGNASAGYFGSSGNLIVRIDSELIEVTANGTSTMPIVNRGFGRSEVKDHSINATVQNCIRFIDEHVVDCITYALETWTQVPAEFIDDYSDVIALNPTAIISDYVLSSPRDVVDFINMCIFIGNLSFYFDDVEQKIVIKYVTEFSANQVYIDDINTIKKGTGKRDLNYKEQWTRFNLSWAPFDITKDTDQKNYQTSLTAINADLESPNKRGEVNEKKAILVPMLTASSADYLLGAAAVNRVLTESKQVPDIFECELDAESIGDTQGARLELGSVVSIKTSSNQDKSGQAIAGLYQAVRISGDAFAGFKVKFKRFQSFIPQLSEYDYAIEPGTYINYVLTDHFNPPSEGVYTVYIKEGSVFGSYNAAIAAFRTGMPAAGVSFRFIARWQLMGMGGAGGDAGIYGTPNEQGEVGGTAFEANCDVEIDNGVGLIWAGGGGGDGQSYLSYPGPTFIPRLGGGGGQGYGYSVAGRSTNGISFVSSAEGGNITTAGNYENENFGGGWGEDGYNATGRSSNAGIAVKSNGFSVTFTAGDNTNSIRGRRT